MERVVYQVLTSDNEFSILFPTLYQDGAVVDKPQPNFGVYKFVGSPRLGRNSSAIPRLELWLYQPRGSYDVINRGLKRADDLLAGIADLWVGDQHVAQADPQGWSGYLYDDIYRCNTRNSAYVLAGSPG